MSGNDVNLVETSAASRLALTSGSCLADLGYGAEAETITLYADVADVSLAPGADIECLPRPTPEWLAAMAALQGRSPEERAVYELVVGSIAIPAVFAGVRVDDQYAALAFGALHDGLLCFESLITGEAFRGRGYARRLMGALLGWGAEQGADGVCLQVEAWNTSAISLYRNLGLTTELYRYHYRREPART